MPITIDGNNTPTAGGIGYGDGTELAFTSAGSSGQVLTSNGASAPAFAAIPATNLATGVTGTLPIANGGTGTTSTTFANLTTNVTGTLPVGNGGTGATTLTANNVLLGNGTSAIQTVAPGASGNILTSNGTTWQSTAPAGSSPWVYLGQVNPTGSTYADITGFFDSTYQLYVITMGFICTDNTNTQQFYCRFFLNGSVYSGSSYAYNNSSWIANNNQFFNGQSQINFNPQSYQRADGSFFLSGIVYVPSPTVNGYKQIYGFINGIYNPVTNTFGASEYSNGGQLTGLRFYFSSGNFGSNVSTQSIFRVYGIKNS